MPTSLEPVSVYQTLSPTTEKVLKVYPEATDEEVKKALDVAHDTYKNDWRQRSVADRAAIVAKAASILRKKQEDLAQLMTLEMGKLIPQARYVWHHFRTSS